MNFIRNFFHKYHIQITYEYHIERKFNRKYSVKKSKEKKLATRKALEHFDDFYGGIFKHRWHSVRLGLLSHPKHVALLNNFGEIGKTKELLKNEGALDLRVLLREEKPELDDIKECNRDDFIETIHEHDKNGSAICKNIEEEDVLKAFYPEGSDKHLSKLTNYNIKEAEEEEKEEEEEEEKEEECGTSEDPASLHKALSQSKIDTSRLIDPSLGLDSSSLYEYVPVTELKGKEDYLPEGNYYQFYKINPDIDIHTEPQYELPFPKHLHIYSYPRGDVSRFPPPRFNINRVYSYYPLDGASVLPVLALGLEPGDRILDMCAAPGGKSLIMLQTMLPDLLVCNDSSRSRCNRLRNVFHQFLDNYPDSWRDTVVIKTVQGERYESDNNYNKILVDVPCTMDRISATKEDNNIFKSSRTKERLSLPEYQANILENALSIVEPGGTVVYSTCTLSPIQNDGVVKVALQNVWRKHCIECTVVDLNPALDKMKHFYQFATQIGLKYGSLVLPFMPVNFGPMYFCKLVKNK